jgi:hypothetical protein
MTRTTVTKRIIGVGGDVVRVHGEYSDEYRSRYNRYNHSRPRPDDETDAIVGYDAEGERRGGEGGGHEYECNLMRDGIDDNQAMAVRRAGVPHDVRFPIPFCQMISSLSSTSSSSSTLSMGGRDVPRSNDVGWGAGTTSSSLCQRDCAAYYYAVPLNHIWLEGDNPYHSTDSRHYGPVPEASLRGRIVMRMWPVGGAMVDAKRPRPPDL